MGKTSAQVLKTIKAMPPDEQTEIVGQLKLTVAQLHQIMNQHTPTECVEVIQRVIKDLPFDAVEQIVYFSKNHHDFRLNYGPFVAPSDSLYHVRLILRKARHGETVYNYVYLSSGAKNQKPSQSLLGRLFYTRGTEEIEHKPLHRGLIFSANTIYELTSKSGKPTKLIRLLKLEPPLNDLEHEDPKALLYYEELDPKSLKPTQKQVFFPHCVGPDGIFSNRLWTFKLIKLEGRAASLQPQVPSPDQSLTIRPADSEKILKKFDQWVKLSQYDTSNFWFQRTTENGCQLCLADGRVIMTYLVDELTVYSSEPLDIVAEWFTAMTIAVIENPSKKIRSSSKNLANALMGIINAYQLDPKRNLLALIFEL